MMNSYNELKPKFSFELKIKGDSYNGHYTNGLSLANGASVRCCKLIKSSNEKTVYMSERYNVTVYHIQKGDVTECYTEINNISDKDINIDLLSSFCIENIDADIIHRITSFWSAEGKLLTQSLCELNMEQSWSGHGTRVEKFGQIGSMSVRKWHPFVALENSKTNQFVGIQLYCASSWQIEILRNTQPITVTGGLADFDYGHWSKTLKAGETFTSPKAVVTLGNSLNDVCDSLVKAQSPDISKVDEDMPIIFNEYCTTWGNPTKENIIKIAEKIKNIGVKYFVIDSGWYKKPNEDWWATIGDWNESKELFPNGIKEIADVIKSYGMIAGIWFEFEKCANQSEMYYKDNHLLKRDGVPIDVDGQRFLDMRDSWCVDYLDKKVIDFLRDNGFMYVKVDYNDSIGVGCDGDESLGEGLRKTVAASQQFFAKMKGEIPDLVIEICSSGGHRLEPSMMELASQASFSDAHECDSIPIIAANCHRIIRPEQSQIWAVLRATDDIHRINYSLTAAMLGRLCLSGDIFDISDECWQCVQKGIDFYNRIKTIIKKGKTTVIKSTVKDYFNPNGYQIVLREYENIALLIVHTFHSGANPPFEEYINGFSIVEAFGSEVDADYRGKAFLLKKDG